MRRLAATHHPNEVGTSLVGTYSDDGHRATVTALAPLTNDSRGARSTFYRGASGLGQFFRGLFTSSKGLAHYVGEWHSHPGGVPTPSGTDDANMFAIASAAEAKCPECILMIVATNGDRAELGVFVYSRTRGRIEMKIR
jgi:integrative and conjugative element protein (TIGR02256 family)